MKFRDKVPGSDGGHFLVIKNGESAVGVFRGEPYDFFALWKDKQSTIVEEGTPGAKFRFRINFITKDVTGYQAKIWEQGSVVYGDLKNLDQALREEGSSLEETVIKIVRQGSGLDTAYTLLPLKSQVTADVKSVPLQKLNIHPSTSETSTYDFGPPPPETNDEIPF